LFGFKFFSRDWEAKNSWLIYRSFLTHSGWRWVNLFLLTWRLFMGHYGTLIKFFDQKFHYCLFLLLYNWFQSIIEKIMIHQLINKNTLMLSTIRQILIFVEYFRRLCLRYQDDRYNNFKTIDHMILWVMFINSVYGFCEQI
jgi:hypothetical protein